MQIVAEKVLWKVTSALFPWYVNAYKHHQKNLLYSQIYDTQICVQINNFK